MHRIRLSNHIEDVYWRSRLRYATDCYLHQPDAEDTEEVVGYAERAANGIADNDIAAVSSR